MARDGSASRAAVIREGLAAVDGCEIFVVTERRGRVARIGEIAPDIVLMDLGSPSRDVLEEYFAVSRVLGRQIAMFVDESGAEAIAASVNAEVSSYVVDGLAPHRIRPIFDLAVRRFNAFARLQSDLAEAKGSPRLLLLDEPFGVLDSLARWDLQDVLIEVWNRTHVTAIMVTHEVDEAILQADRVVVMTNGPNATIGKVLKVDLPRPRDRKALLRHPDVHAHRQEVLHFLAEYDHGPTTKAA